jgi:hypothetical protein
MFYALRYYAPCYEPAVHEAILALLAQVNGRYGVPYEVVEVRHSRSTYADGLIAERAHQKEIYERDFLPRKAVLKFRTGEQLGRLLRSRSGNHFVAGTVAITAKGQVHWLAHYGSQFAGAAQEPQLAFLRALLERGPQLLPELCPPVVRGAPEQALLDTFIRLCPIPGTISAEVKVGGHRFTVDDAEFDWRKSVDLVIENERETWILEGKQALNYEALGEVLTYAALYQRTFPAKLVRRAIVCRRPDGDILQTCSDYDVTVFLVDGEAVQTYEPRASCT